jgi:nucleoside-diphosphate-sugar epimerase
VGEIYIIAGPRQTLVEVLQIAAEITGLPAPGLQVSPGMMKAMAGLMGLVEKVIPVPEAYTGSNAKARHGLGYNPRSLKEGLTETLHREMRLLRMK